MIVYGMGCGLKVAGRDEARNRSWMVWAMQKDVDGSWEERGQSNQLKEVCELRMTSCRDVVGCEGDGRRLNPWTDPDFDDALGFFLFPLL